MSETVAAKKKATKAKSTADKSAGRASAKKSTKKAAGKSTTKAAAKGGASKSAGKKAAAKKTAAAKTTAKKTPAKKAVSKKAVSKQQTATKTSGKASKSTSSNDSNEAPTRTIPASAKYLLDSKWLDGQRDALMEERAKYTSSADRLAAEAAALMADREPGDVQFDEESGEGDTIAVERDRDLALSAAARQAVADIDAALARLDDNTYGLCIAGDDVIPKERLEAIPEAAVCVQHKTSMF